MFNKLKQINDLRSKAKVLQESLSKEFVTGTSGWGDKVKITINGTQEVTNVEIDASAMDDREKLQSMVKDAANDAMKNLQKTMATKLKDMGGMDLANELGDLMKQ
ncbi:MAG: YbaB/EbfC family nucleoid-associated protein [Candidatus Magasanikbacteria bacterium]|nr:YbaB/EbfC family nucleoid-associated protein [Candidatus Magasanikbacteria bacterium]MCA9389388.1 YbaB/EbfC family nucleoid-associated protein [Candidatus Magasanikbacteria bacterium]MCA9391531.1 YbaB/EbfC family nucleoid-associated protein [Candidatus Magasanikbacteria bacterium]USN52818.1 MAG: YbaB/EbfC family nucleoid-associated protein [Candidatus Nomurabacteria bacterium]HPF95545.1 YbaB/EbfC family nucleoid-associated protein [bacterium]